MNLNLQQVKSVVESAKKIDRNVLLVPAFEGRNVIYKYEKQGNVLKLQNHPESKHRTLPARWAGKDIHKLDVYCKILRDADGGQWLYAVACKVDNEKEFGQNRNMLLDLNLLDQAGFQTSLGLAHVYGPYLTPSDVRDYYKVVQEMIGEGRISLWSHDVENLYPEPAGVQAFLL